jgi:hypothetical protein
VDLPGLFALARLDLMAKERVLGSCRKRQASSCDFLLSRIEDHVRSLPARCRHLRVTCVLANVLVYEDAFLHCFDCSAVGEDVGELDRHAYCTKLQSLVQTILDGEQQCKIAVVLRPSPKDNDAICEIIKLISNVCLR